jgi:putative DNA primase/helicase
MDVVGERLLSISGEGTVTVERKFLPSITLKLATRFVFMTNEMPRITDASGALASRFLILQFTESFYGREDITLTDRLATELSGIVLWAIEGLARLREQGRFTQLPEQLMLVEQMEELASPVSAFLRDECILPHQALDEGLKSDELASPVEAVWGRWQWWAKHNGHSEGSKIDLGRKLAAVLPKFKKVRPGGDGDRYHLYQGFKLRDRPAEEEYAGSGSHGSNRGDDGEFDF